MNPDYFKKVQQLSHEDDRRYLLLMSGLRIIHDEKKRHSPLQRFKLERKALGRKIKVQSW